MKKFLIELIERKKTEMANLIKRSEESQDVAEVRAIGTQLEAIRSEISAAETQLANIEADEQRGANPDGGVPAGVQLRNGQVVGSFSCTQRDDTTDRHDTVEYREAFMNYVCRGVEIPLNLRQDAVTQTTDASAVIPTTIMNEIVRELDAYGNVYALVRKLNVQGGVAIPILSLKPDATWIGETTPSEKKKLQANTSITFSYFGIECKIAQTLLANVTTLDMFQQLFVPLAAEAIVRGVEIAIFNGNGTTQPTGILTDSRVPSDNVITLSPSEFTSWSAWHTKVKAKMKKAYRNGTFFMAQGTFDGYIDGMTDDNGQPVGRTNYGINGEEAYRFMGKSVETVEDGCISSYDDAEVNDVVAVFMKPTDYAINSNMQMTTVKWVDNDTNEIKNKCIMICDGKLVDPNGVLIIKKGAEA